MKTENKLKKEDAEKEEKRKSANFIVFFFRIEKYK